MPELSEVGVHLKIEGGEVAAAKLKAVEEGLRKIGLGAAKVAAESAGMNAATEKSIAVSTAHVEVLGKGAAAGEKFGESLGSKVVPALKKVDSALDSLSGKLWHWSGTAVTAGAVGFAGLTAAAAGFGLKAVASLQDTQVAYENLTGSMSAGQTLFGQIQGLKQQTPFEASDLNNAAQTLLQGGVGQSSILPLMKSLADVAASAPEAQRAGNLAQSASILAKINANGTATSSDLVALGAAGVPVQKLTGETGAQLSAGNFTMSAADLLSAIQSGAAGGQGNAARAASTLSGSYSNLKASVNDALGTAAQPLADAIQTELPGITAAVTSLVSEVAPPITKMLTTVLHGLEGLMPVLGPILSSVASGVDRVFTAAAPGLKALEPLGGVIGQSISDLFTSLAGIMPDLVPLFGDMVKILPDFVHDLQDLLPVVDVLARLLDSLLRLPHGTEVASWGLVAAFGWPVIGPIVGALGKLAASLWAVEEAEVAAAGAGGVAGAAGAAGGAAGAASRFGRFGALGALGVAGLAIGGVYEGVTGTLSTIGHGITGSSAFKTIGGMTATGAAAGLAGGPFAEVTVPAGAAVGLGAGIVTTVGGGLIHHFTTNNDVKVEVHNPHSNVDVAQAVEDALAADRAKQDRRR